MGEDCDELNHEEEIRISDGLNERITDLKIHITVAASRTVDRATKNGWCVQLKKKVTQCRLLDGTRENEKRFHVFFGEREVSSKLPLLSRGTHVALTPPMTSTQRKRLFSVAGLIRAKRHSRLTPDITEELVTVSPHLRSNRAN